MLSSIKYLPLCGCHKHFESCAVKMRELQSRRKMFVRCQASSIKPLQPQQFCNPHSTCGISFNTASPTLNMAWDLGALMLAIEKDPHGFDLRSTTEGTPQIPKYRT
jgi:hypothetical protein